MAEPGRGEVGTDTLFGGRLALEQFRHGHRVGTDAVLLSAAADVQPGDIVLDLGAGVGAIGLSLALREPRARATLVEIDSATATLAERNVAANGLAERVTVACLDIFDRAACGAAGLLGSASLVVTNPPFYSAAAVRPSPDPSRVTAHVLGPQGPGSEGHGAWLERACAFLKPDGRLVMIHRPSALPVLLPAMTGRIGSVWIKPVLPRTECPATRVLVGGRRSSKGPLELLAPLVLHDASGEFTPEAARLHGGEAMAPWPKENRP
jgi:tRNA1(Val) A37 N6-methylase TrmN6